MTATLWHKPNSSIISWEFYGGFHLEIEHDGTATWADLQEVKNFVVGKGRGCKEYYPPQEFVVNGNSTEFHYRHLWVMKKGERWYNLRKDNHF